MLAVIGGGFIATTVQAQQDAVPERNLAADMKPAPLKLSPPAVDKIPTKTFGDWTQRCDTRPGVVVRKCFLTQTVVQTENKKRHGLLAISVGLIGPDKKPAIALRVPLSLGILLPPGFLFYVPGIEPTRIVVQSCLTIGCIAKLPLVPQTIAAMQKVDTGTLEIHTLRKKVIKVPISFKGFAAGLESLNKG
jgi:invasion protein IalB